MRGDEGTKELGTAGETFQSNHCLTAYKKSLMDLWFIPYSPHFLACSKLGVVGSARLRKCDHENKTEGSWGEEGRLSLSFSRHCPLFPDHAKSRAHVFACVSFTRHPYYLRAWNRLLAFPKQRYGKVKRKYLLIVLFLSIRVMKIQVL